MSQSQLWMLRYGMAWRACILRGIMAVAFGLTTDGNTKWGFYGRLFIIFMTWSLYSVRITTLRLPFGLGAIYVKGCIIPGLPK